jgi:hypothetical protein
MIAATGSLQPLDNPSKLSRLVSLAHTRGVKVLISVGSWERGIVHGWHVARERHPHQGARREGGIAVMRSQSG